MRTNTEQRAGLNSGTVGATTEVADTVATRLSLMDRTVDLLIEQAKNADLCLELYERARRVLNSLPLATGGFALAEGRLRNALTYAQQSEYGAAAFELRMLRGVLAA